MKAKEYFRLAKLSLASRKSTSRSTVRGISFGLILLIPVIFVSVGLFGDLNAQVNKNPELLYVNMKIAAERTGKTDIVSEDFNSSVIAFSHTQGIIQNVQYDEAFLYEQIYASFDSASASRTTNQYQAFSFGIDGAQQIPIYLALNDSYSFSYNISPFAAILSNQDNFVPQKVLKKFPKIFVDGMDKGFTGDGKGQVILSEMFLQSIGVSNIEIYGKTFSIQYTDNPSDSLRVINDSIYIDSDSNPSNDSYGEIESNYRTNTKTSYFCYRFEVVGIVRKEVTDYAKKAFKEYNYSEHIMSNMMFFAQTSAVMPAGDALEPIITEYTSTNDDYISKRLLATYSFGEAAFQTLNEEYMCFGANNFNSFKRYGSDFYPQQTLFLDASNFAQLDSMVGSISSQLSEFFSFDYSDPTFYLSSNLYSQLSLVYKIFTYLIMFLAIMGGIIFFAAMVNLFNSIVHIVDTGKKYLAVMRAVGAKNGVIPKLYLAESLTLFRRCLVWVVIFAGLICTGIKLALDSAFEYVNSNNFFPLDLNINVIFIPISILIGMSLLIVLGIVFAFGCSYSIANKPIMSILGES